MNIRVQRSETVLDNFHRLTFYGAEIKTNLLTETWTDSSERLCVLDSAGNTVDPRTRKQTQEPSQQGDSSSVPVRQQVQTHDRAEPHAHAGGHHGLVRGVVGHPLLLRVEEAVDDLRVGVQTAELAVEAVGDATWEMHHHVAVHLSRQPGETGEETQSERVWGSDGNKQQQTLLFQKKKKKSLNPCHELGRCLNSV